MSPQLVAESYALTDSINRAISLRRQMFACEERLDRLELAFSSDPNVIYANEMRELRLDADRIGRQLLAAYDEIDAINRRRDPGREAGG